MATEPKRGRVCSLLGEALISGCHLLVRMGQADYHTCMRRYTRWRSMRVLLPGLVLLLQVAGCAGVSYSARDPRLGSDRVESTIYLRKDHMEARTSAGRYRVVDVALRLADGSLVKPGQNKRLPDEIEGGVSVGIGVGTGGYSRGGYGGVGTSRSVGGKLYPGALSSVWHDPPVEKQPWRLVVQVAGDPPILVNLPLGKVIERREVTEPDLLADGFAELQRWKLPDGSKQWFLAKPGEDPPVYEPAGDEVAPAE